MGKNVRSFNGTTVTRWDLRQANALRRNFQREGLADMRANARGEQVNWWLGVPVVTAGTADTFARAIREYERLDVRYERGDG